MPDKDVQTVGVSPAADSMIKDLLETDWFDREVDVYRVSLSVALGLGLKPHPAEGRVTKFNTGTLETSPPQIAMIIQAVAGPTDRPFALSQDYAEAGIRHLHEALVVEGTMLHELFQT
jgi:hypothetical protein